MLQNIVNWKTILLSTVGVFVALSSMQVLHSPDTVLDDVLVADEGGHVVLQVKSNIPLRYENHFPESPSNLIQVKVRTVSLLGIQRNEYLGNESILPGFVEQVPIIDVAYEGNVLGGPFISMRFKDKINYTIKEDPDLSGIHIIIQKKTDF